MTRFVLGSNPLNEVQISTIRKMIAKARGASTVDLLMRVNGEDLRFQADWLKHLTEEQ